MQEIKARHGKVIAITNSSTHLPTGLADDVIDGARRSTQRSRITDICCIFSPILNSSFISSIPD
jgi:hypothetical protein